MTRNLATRALLIVGLLFVGTVATYAQSMSSQVRRVAPGKEHLQPVAASAVALGSSMGLTADQRAQIGAISAGATALQSERARLWAEYRSIVARPGFDDAMAVAEAAPRMLRIVAINNELTAIAGRQDAALKSVLTPAQQSELSGHVARFRNQMAD
jgi:Spy/CpxP family protein refolding chaperone